MIRKKHITLCFSLFLALSMVLGQLIPVAATDAGQTVETTGPAKEVPGPEATAEDDSANPESPGETVGGGESADIIGSDGMAGDDANVPTMEETSSPEEENVILDENGKNSETEEESASAESTDEDEFAEKRELSFETEHLTGSAKFAVDAFEEEPTAVEVKKLDDTELESARDAAGLDEKAESEETTVSVGYSILFKADDRIVEPKSEVLVSLKLSKEIFAESLTEEDEIIDNTIALLNVDESDRSDVTVQEYSVANEQLNIESDETVTASFDTISTDVLIATATVSTVNKHQATNVYAYVLFPDQWNPDTNFSDMDPKTFTGLGDSVNTINMWGQVTRTEDRYTYVGTCTQAITGDDYQNRYDATGTGLHAEATVGSSTYSIDFPENDPQFPAITRDGKVYTYDPTGKKENSYSVTWRYLVGAMGTTASTSPANDFNPRVGGDTQAWHLDGVVTLNDTEKINVNFLVKEPGASTYTLPSNNAQMLVEKNTVELKMADAAEQIKSISEKNVQEKYPEDYNDYEFVGWYRGEPGDDGDMVTADENNLVDFANSTFQFESNVTYFAKYKAKTQSLTVRNTVTGNGAEAGKSFSYVLNVYDKKGNPVSEHITVSHSGNHDLTTLTNSNGGYSFALKSGETLTIPELNKGYTFEIVQQQTDKNGNHDHGYDTTVNTPGTQNMISGNSHKHNLNEDRQVSFINDKTIKVPSGLDDHDSAIHGLTLSAGAGLLLVGAIIALRRRINAI